MKRLYMVLIALLCLAGSCADKPAPQRSEPSVPAPGPEQPAPPPPVPSASPASAPEPVFDPSSITQEEKDTAKLEIQRLIQRLNGIIRTRNYDTWVSYLDPGYFAAINSPEYLDRVSQSAVLVKQKIVLASAEDYFNHVVVPSRTNDRVDDIEFISQNRVKAYTINTAGNRLRLYDLEKSGTGWKIIN
ncbi:MAG: hypothetical protein LBK74_00065 [Treponema sp.]|jgi:hypothetical protein|nr:hypothetical protein [Treponema sp.]